MKKDLVPKEEPTLKADEFMQMLKISPNTFKKLLSEGRVPKPLPLGTRSRRWSRSVVMSFLNKPACNACPRNTNGEEQ
jgi:predicted DNA-binding transcriptional regulator AlpA